MVIRFGVREYQQESIDHLERILHYTARNIALVTPSGLSVHPDNRISQIINYIQLHIRRSELLKINVIAEKFGMSSTYLGSYFSRQCSEYQQQYTSAYRLRLIEHHLRFSAKRIHKIADEFGSADQSHINKFFKRHRQMSLKAFRIGLIMPTTI